MNRLLILVSLAITLVGNLVPLYGVLYWNWDTFQLLMLYWTETLIIAFWTLMRIATMPAAKLGNIKVNGKERAATNAMLVTFFSFHAGIFMTVHLFFLWILFSGEWLKKVTGVGSFFRELYVANGIWIALVIMFIAAGFSYFARVARPAFLQWIERWLHPDAKFVEATETPEKPGSDGVGPVIGTLYVRIMIMQFAVIFGAWFAQSVGSIAPLLIVIGLKTLFDLGANTYAAAFGKDMTLSTGNTTMALKS